MIRAEIAIARLKRDLTLSLVVKAALLCAAVVALFFDTLTGHEAGSAVALAAVFVVWLALSYRSMKGSRMAAFSPVLIASGDFDRAEEHIDLALRSFSLFRAVKLRTLHHLALLRHAQQRWADTVLLCRELLRQRLGAMGGLSRSARLILADSLLEVGDLRGAHEAITALYRERLPLGEAMELLAVQTDYLARTGAWDHLIVNAARKVEMAELLPAAKSARIQAMLALAAAKTGKHEWEQWLRRRVELLADKQELLRQRPMLSELWP